MSAHSASDHAQEFLEALPDLLAGESEILQFKISDMTELDL